jgi:hypothetical protein
MDIQILLQQEDNLKKQLTNITKKLDELYKIFEQADIELRVYWLDDDHIHGELFTAEYDKIFTAFCMAEDDILAYENLQDKIESSYLKLSTKLRTAGY